MVCGSRGWLGYSSVLFALIGCTGEIGAAPDGRDVERSSAPLTINVADGFESGNLTTGGWTGTGEVTVVAAAARSGSFGARLGRTGVISTTLNTTGFQNIQVTFDWRAVAIDLFEYGAVEYQLPGGAFTQLATVTAATFATPTFSLPATADNRTGVVLRFRVSATAFLETTWEGIDIDNVIVKGTAIAPPECTTDATCGAGRICQAGRCVSHCGDGLRNGNETGVDCGGACAACSSVVTLLNETFSSGLTRFTLDPAARVTSITGAAAYQSGPSAQLTVTASMQTTLATTGYDNLVLRYVRGTTGLDTGEYLTSEVSTDGVNYTQVERIQTGALAAVSFPLAATFANQPALRIRFRSVGSYFFIPETAVVDNIALEGRAIATMPGCATDAQCSAMDSACMRGACTAGMCTSVARAAGTACGSATATECNAADTCNGSGSCQTNLRPAGTACGDPIATACNAADSCDGAGACLPRFVASGSACGDPLATQCNQSDSCDGAGACLPRYVASGTACGDATNTPCNAADRCDGAGGCAANYAAAGTACGSATATACDAADSCSGSGACLINRSATGASCGSGGKLCDNGTCVTCGGTPNSTYGVLQSRIFDSSSYGCTSSVCHGATGSGGLDLRAPNSWSHLFEVQANASAMDRIAPNDPDNSYLYRKLAWATLGTPVEGGGPMPASGPAITARELQGLSAWIAGGAPQTGYVAGSLLGLCTAPCTTNADCNDGNACNGAETCQVSTGTCVAGSAPNCNDSVACTEDRCDPAAGCQHTLTAGLPCSGGVCSAAGACVSCVAPANTYDAIQSLIFDSPTYGCTTPSCHGAPSFQNGLDLTAANSYSELFEAGRNRVVPGNAAGSRLFDKLNAGVQGTLPTTGGSPMPQGRPPISVAQLAGIQSWINGGAPRTGVVSGTESSLCFPATPAPANLTLLWDFPTSKGVTGKINIVGTTVYATSWNGSVYALNRVSGAQLWSYNTAARAVQGGVAVAGDGTLVVGDGEAVVRRLNASGGVIWTRDLDQTNADHIWQAVTISGDVIYVPIASHSDVPCTKGRVMALRLSDGATLWTRYNVPQGNICQTDTAIACTSSAQCPGGGSCVSALGGSVTGRIQVDPDGQSIYLNTVGCYTFPSVGDSDSMLKLDAQTGDTLWTMRTDPTEQFKYCMGGTASGSLKGAGADCRTNAECASNWCQTKPNYHDFGFINGPWLVDARTAAGGTRRLVVSASKNGTVYALDAANGAVAWTRRVLPPPVSPNFAGYGLFNGAMAYHKGKFFAALYQFSPAVSPAPEHLMAISEVDGSVAWTDDIGISWSSVGAAGGTVYTGTQASRTLYAYDANTGARLNAFSLPSNSAAEPVVDGNVLFVGYGIDGAGGVRAYRIDP